ncbi:MAG: 30S ribosome-binding factor RbfA [Stygiobacter sp.]|jgi:ribosome-binding factor A|uniref:Ribosome-binding factor A n=1 Tax=Stygiobacter electus TaxID=3032292 RepID=A0AAE3P0Y7_9BACT|nr:30S ribosome-binding factor RbfA [Stygiobacter electus]MDF1610810.1 30S ribosome-binding factor RbfA [Stygiobacter electus]
MASHRLERVSHQIKDELSLIFLHKVQDKKFGLITVTNVKVTPDLREAKIYLSVFEKELRAELLSKVNELKGLIRTELAHKIQLRYVPELFFFIDDTLDYVEKIEKLFKEIHDNEKHED